MAAETALNFAIHVAGTANLKDLSCSYSSTRGAWLLLLFSSEVQYRQHHALKHTRLAAGYAGWS
jgi:hypothetical protein